MGEHISLLLDIRALLWEYQRCSEMQHTCRSVKGVISKCCQGGGNIWLNINTGFSSIVLQCVTSCE